MKQALMAAVLFAAMTSAATGQTPVDTLALSLTEARARAVTHGEEIRFSRSQVGLARAQIRDARAGALPQVSASVGYTRTFASQFEGGFQLPDSLKFEPDSLASVTQRLRYLEDKAPVAGLMGLGALFSNLPFGQENAYATSVSGSQLLYSGGRTGAALAIAKSYREAAELQLQEDVADIDLAVQTSYYRALFALERERISRAAVAQAEEFLTQEQLREKTGVSSELDVLRAEVALANLHPQAIEARNASEIASLDLKRLVNVPAAQPLKLTTELEIPTDDCLQESDSTHAGALARRAAIGAAERQVRMRELAVRIARGAFLPSVAVQMSWARLAFPADPFRLGGIEWRTDWSAALGVQIPIFDGLRRSAQVDQAQAQLIQARLRLEQLREGVALEYERATGERERAAATIAARQVTVTQAQRVHDLTVLRYERGLATQLEVSDARLALLQARTNLVQALSEFYVADATAIRALGGNQISRSR